MGTVLPFPIASRADPAPDAVVVDLAAARQRAARDDYFRHRANEIADARRMDGEREVFGEGEC